ncbi:MAG TPA: DUF3524 domain-containing protein [Tepidisphaeraceae bacterium]|nr:DUF3524 domain-containing protein [Tepidisphaeraceae bacterium]
MFHVFTFHLHRDPATLTMPRQLDILALEPFYGGIRRAMLEAVMRYSRHRWTLLKLPPRRVERRLAVAANWFAEHLIRHFSGRVDLLFTSEAMNLANLYRLVPDMARRPSIVYFHDNHLPDVMNRQDGPFDLVNLNTASAATEIWFNAEYHQRTFFKRATALVFRHPELSSQDPMRAIGTKARILPPPIDLGLPDRVRSEYEANRQPGNIFVETRDADLGLLNAALELLAKKGRKVRLVTVGPIKQLSDQWERHTIKEIDEIGQIVGMLESSVLVSLKQQPNSDYLFVRGMLAGCQPVVPDHPTYQALIPESLHTTSLYRPDAQSLATKLGAALDTKGWPLKSPDWRRVFAPFDAAAACAAIDDRIDELAGA